jgi:hypothetical protein
MAANRKKKASNEQVDREMATKLGVAVHRTGRHLTVSTFPDGHQELSWDDEALAREVREAIASVENK